jgi:hypothetical protein
MEKALELVEQLAVKLGVAAEYLMTVLVKQQYAEGITSLIMAGVDLFIIVAMLIFIPKVTKKIYSEYERLRTGRLNREITGYDGSYFVSSGKEDFFGTMTYIIPIASVILGIVLLACGIDSIKIGVQQLINPEYFAFKEILDVISAG